MIDLDEIAAFLDDLLAIAEFGDDPGGIYRRSPRLIQRLGLALEPWPELRSWVETEDLDGVFLHRPWKLEPQHLPPDVGVISYHLAFDEHFTLGFNLRLAQVLGLKAIEPFGEKQGRCIGMIGQMQSQMFANYSKHIAEVFGGLDSTQTGRALDVSQVAVVGAMTDSLVRQAANQGAEVYITGQLRQPARQAVQETGLSVVAVGHQRSELWGLRSLAGVLRERWSALEVVLAPISSN